MKTTLSITLLLLASFAQGSERTVAEKLQTVSVTVRAGQAQGSGVILLRHDVNFVLTAGHVVSDLRHEGRTESGKTSVFFDDAQVVQELIENGRKVGQVMFTAKVVSFSKYKKPGEDLALLRIYKKHAYNESAILLPNALITPVGTHLLHCGSLLGQFGSNSMTSGIMSQVGRILDDTVFDQTSCTAFPGSSGGGVFTEDGHYIGMVVRGNGEGFNFIIPVRRIQTWATRVHADFIFDPAKPLTDPDR